MSRGYRVPSISTKAELRSYIATTISRVNGIPLLRVTNETLLGDAAEEMCLMLEVALNKLISAQTGMTVGEFIRDVGRGLL